jgi:hypothetical protein
VIVAGCAEALNGDGYGEYDVPTSFRSSDCYSAPIDEINSLMENSEMKIEFPMASKTLYIKLVDENGDAREFSMDSHVFQWKWDELGDYMGPCGHDDQNSNYNWLFVKSSNYAAENCESGNYESGINANGFFSNDWEEGTSFWADQSGWDSDIVISVNVQEYCADHVTFTYEQEEMGYCGDDSYNRICSVDYNGGILPANESTCLNVEGHWQGDAWIVDSSSGEWSVDVCDIRCSEMICDNDVNCGGYTYFKEYGTIRLASVISYTQAAGGTYCMAKVGGEIELVGEGGACRLNETFADLDARDFGDYPGMVYTESYSFADQGACNNLCYAMDWCSSFAYSSENSKCILYDWIPTAISNLKSDASYSCYVSADYVPEATLPPAAEGCADNIDGGGWSLVRRVKQGRKWHPATDGLAGTDVYGTFVNDGSVGETFSRYYASELDGTTEFLFSSGDCYHWLITNELNAVYRRGEPYMGEILTASDIQQYHEVQWYHRSTSLEDPWISLKDHLDSVYDATVLYGENDWYGDSRDSLLSDHNGANVYIRPSERTPAPGNEDLIRPAPDGPSRLSVPSPGNGQDYLLPAPKGTNADCCAIFLGPNEGEYGEYQVRLDLTGCAPGEESVAPSVQHMAPAGVYTIRANVYITDDWDGTDTLLHSRMFDEAVSEILSIDGGSTSVRNHWEWIEETIDTGTTKPGYLDIYIGYPMQNSAGFVKISQLTVTDADGYNWADEDGQVNCDTGISGDIADHDDESWSYGNVGLTTVSCDFDVIPAPSRVVDQCTVKIGPWAGESATSEYCNWYLVREDAMCRDKVWLGKGNTLPECWALVEADDRCGTVMYGDGDSSCACAPIDNPICDYTSSTVGNNVYEQCCSSLTVEQSCWGNCGFFTSDAGCFCTQDCTAAGDCCDDYEAVCRQPAPDDDFSDGGLDLPAPHASIDDAPAPKASNQQRSPRQSPTPSPGIESDMVTNEPVQEIAPSPGALTCKGSCQYPWTSATSTGTASCFCDVDCYDYNDCCEDKETWCRNGCTNQACTNYDAAALVDDGGCYQCILVNIPAPKVAEKVPSPVLPSPGQVNPSPKTRTPTPTPSPGRREQDWPTDWKPAPDNQNNQHNTPSPDQSCVGNCRAPWHSASQQACWCDDDCDKWNDCCEDKETACPVTPAQRPSPHPGPAASHIVPSPTPGPDSDENDYDEANPSPRPAPTKDSNGEIASMPSPSETDPVISCNGYCDYPYHSSIPNSCWCDVFCIEHGDCCDDRDMCISECELDVTEIYEKVLCRTPTTDEIVDLLDACEAPGENVADTKSVCTMSTIYDDDTGCDAVIDGKSSTACKTCASDINTVCDDTCAEEDPFIMFDLSVQNAIGMVQISNVGDSCASRLFAHGGACDWTMSSATYENFNEGAIVGLSDEPCVEGKGCNGIECGKLTQANEFGNYEVDCNGQYGRYVWVYLPGECRILSMSEITVETPDSGIGMWYGEIFDETGNEGFCEDHTTNYLCANGIYEYLNGGFAPKIDSTCDLANENGVWDAFACGHECTQELCSSDGNCAGYVAEKSGNMRPVNLVNGVTKQEDSHCYKQGSALGDRGKKTFPLIEYELYNSEEFEDCAWCQAACDADPMDCVGSWGEWGTCSASCGDGTAIRYFFVEQEEYSGGVPCDYKDFEEQSGDCQTGVLVNGEIFCPINCEGTWEDWTDCTVTCGGGEQSRLFEVTQMSDYGGYTCEDIYQTESSVVEVGDQWTEVSSCSDSYCPSDCDGAWSDWTECPVTCGSESSTFDSYRTYEIFTPARLGGDECPEFDGSIESISGYCATDACAVDITIWVDDDLNEYWINDALSQWIDEDGYIIGTIDLSVDPAIVSNSDGDAIAELHMASVTENSIDLLGISNAVDANDDDLDEVAEEFTNTMELDESNDLLGMYASIIGGYSNDIDEDTEFAAIGGGKHNQILQASLYSSITGGLNNIVNGNYATIIGGWKNKIYSNYGVILGGYNNKVSGRFGSVLGGSRNTAAGRFTLAAGYNSITTADYSAVLGFAGAGSSCSNEDSNTVKVCADGFMFNDFDITSLAPGRRRGLTSSDTVSAVIDECEDHLESLRKHNQQLRLLMEKIEAL